MKAKYWLIYSNYKGRRAKPFADIGSMERFIERNKDYITVVARAGTIQ